MSPNLEGLTEEQAYEKGRNAAKWRGRLNKWTGGLLGGVGWGKSYDEMLAAAGSSPHATGNQAAYYAGLADSDYGLRLSKQQEMRTSRSMYQASKLSQNAASVATFGLSDVANAAMKKFTGKGWTDRIAGESQEDSLSDYGRAAASLYGDEKAKRMVNTQRWIGTGIDAAGLVGGLATGGAAGAVAGKALGLASRANSAIQATRAGRAAVGAGNLALKAGKGVVAAGKGIANAGGAVMANTVGKVMPKTYNALTTAGKVVGRTAADFARRSPKAWINAHRKYDKSTRTFQGVADAYNQGEEPTGLVGEGLNMVADYYGTVANWAVPGAAMGSIGRGAKLLNRVVKLPGVVSRPLSYAFGSAPATKGVLGYVKGIPRAIANDVAQGTVMSNAMGFNGPVDWNDPSSILQHTGWVTGRLVDQGLSAASETYRNTSAIAANMRDGTLKAQEGWVDSVMKDPAQLARLKQQFGIRPNAPDNEVRETLLDNQSQLRQAEALANVYNRIDSRFNWDAASPEKRQAKLDKYKLEDRSKLFYNAYRDDILQGYSQGAPAFVNDPNLTTDDRNRLMSLYTQQMYTRKHGLWGTVYDSFMNRDGMVSEIMQNNPAAYETMGKALAQGIAGAGDSKGGFDATSVNAIYRNLKPEDQQRYMQWAVQHTDGGRLANMLINDGADSMEKLDPAMVAQLKSGYMNRMATDGNFAASAFTAAATNAGKTDKDFNLKYIRELNELVRTADPQQLFDSMDDKHFLQLAKLVGANGGEASEALSFLPEQQREELKEKVTKAAKQRAWRAVAGSPFTALPTLAGVWFKQKGWDTVGTMAENPAVFFGTAATLLGGAALAGRTLLGGGQNAGGSTQQSDGSVMDAPRGARPTEDDILEQLAG